MLNFATDIAREAGKLLVQKLGTAKVRTKGDINLVTEADIAAENLIIERIQSYYPQHGILAEESGETVLMGGKRSEWKWIIDPLDGTTNYAHSYPCFCVSIALEHAGVELGRVGVVEGDLAAGGPAERDLLRQRERPPLELGWQQDPQDGGAAAPPGGRPPRLLAVLLGRRLDGLGRVHLGPHGPRHATRT